MLAINSLAALWLVLSGPAAIKAQGQPSRPRIVDRVDENNLYRLTGNTRPEANAANDHGLVADDLPMDHMLLQLRRPPEQEQAIQQFIDQLHDPQSPNFHQWLTAGQIGQAYGPAQEDMDTVTAWLQSHGFTGQCRCTRAACWSISPALPARCARLSAPKSIASDVNGQEHIANMSDPQIPAALAPVVAGVVSLHDFMPHTMQRQKSARPITRSLRSGYHLS